MSVGSRRGTWLARGVVIGAVLLGLGIWFAVTYVGVYRDAQTVRADLTALRSALSARDWPTVATLVPQAQKSAGELASKSDQIPWRVLGFVPFVGTNATGVNTLATALDDLLAAAGPLVPFAQHANELQGADGTVNLQLLEEATPALANLSTVVDEQTKRMNEVDTGHMVSALEEPFTQLRDGLDSLAPGLRLAASAAPRLPGLLGADGKRRWLVLLQNPAEARGSGGFPGAYALLSADDGRLSVQAVGKSDDLNSQTIPIAGAPADSRLMWGDYLTLWRTFNLSPHFPLTGSLAAAGFAARGEPVDGVIAIDPRTVASLLALTGPVTAAGKTLTAENAERYFTVDQYAQVPDMNRRAEVSIALVTAVLDAALKGHFDPVALATALAGPVGAGHVRVWSADHDEESWLASTILGGSVPETPGPVVAVALDNASGNKMDAFVDSAIDYGVGQCSVDGKAPSSVTITLRNDAPRDLPASGDYGRADDPSAPEGSTKLLVYFYAPVDATFSSATLDGKPADVYVGSERKRPVWWRYVTLDRGQRASLTIDFTEPAVTGVEPRVLTQSMVRDPHVTITPQPC